ncbi:hypothetical protein C2W27_14425 [Salmonella enterica]|nr:hypothetical protein [Salmonella enterica]
MKKPSVTLELTVYYSYYLEVMTEALNRRTDRFLCFVQFLLGASVFTDSRYGWLIGFVIALISAVQFSCKPGTAAGHAKLQAHRYKKLCDELPELNRDQVLSRLHKIEENDSQINTRLCNPARLRACIALGLKKDAKLSPCEKVIAYLAGGIPE